MLLAALSEADTTVWRVDPALSKVTFKVRHFGFASVSGEFREFDVQARFNPGDLQKLSVSGKVKVASIDTGNASRDAFVRSQFFAADRYPEMTFRGDRVEKVEGNRVRLVGNLTIRNASKEVVFDVRETGRACIDGENHVAMEVSTTLTKRDMNEAWRDLTRGLGSVFGLEVTITMELDLAGAA